MKRYLRIAIVLALALLVAGGTSPASIADSGGLFKFEDMVGNPPGMTGAAGAIRGVNAAGAPWVVASGEAKLDRDGELKIEVQGLVLISTGTIGSVTGVRASLTCQGSNVVATTGAVPLSTAGDFEIKETIALPSTICVAPILLIRINNATAPWIAATGF